MANLPGRCVIFGFRKIPGVSFLSEPYYPVLLLSQVFWKFRRHPVEESTNRRNVLFARGTSAVTIRWKDIFKTNTRDRTLCMCVSFASASTAPRIRWQHTRACSTGEPRVCWSVSSSLRTWWDSSSHSSSICSSHCNSFVCNDFRSRSFHISLDGKKRSYSATGPPSLTDNAGGHFALTSNPIGFTALTFPYCWIFLVTASNSSSHVAQWESVAF